MNHETEFKITQLEILKLAKKEMENSIHFQEEHKAENEKEIQEPPRNRVRRYEINLVESAKIITRVLTLIEKLHKEENNHHD